MHYINTNIKNRNKTENGMYSKMETLKDDDSNKTHSNDQMCFYSRWQSVSNLWTFNFKRGPTKCSFTFGNIQSH